MTQKTLVKDPNAPRPDEGKPNGGVNNAPLLTGGSFAGAAVIDSYMGTSTSISDLLGNIQERAAHIHGGDLTLVEEMLIGQAVGLQAMFSDLALRAKKASTLDAVHCLTQLALRAQSGSRATLQTLGEIKIPRQVAFVRQTNVAQNQQINNAPTSHAKRIENSPNELIEGAQHASTPLDPRAEATPVRVDTSMAPVESVHGAKKRRR